MVCNGGISGQHFLKALSAVAEVEGYRSGIDFGGVLYDRKALSKYLDYDYLFLFAPATEITREAIESSFVKMDIIMLAPQVRYMLTSIRELCLSLEVKCLAIDPVTFSEMAVKEYFNIIK